ncbi:M16 family metallopeptidase [Lyngbya confervoides]|uniref:Insulinase family protein n=1 Tax=Lyngbya confervoides BDU141951 TaxID=1574623 RepID=A0ABD4T5Q3_9CYAN|nr:pitrilysin family protein [Lyngbya confervoides]MCM1983805.1 insulinase family protein [Lyngbya confervoides BDU141951]
MESVAVPGSSASSSLTAGVQRHVLTNGLVVLTKPIHTAPVVSVQVWYRVGGRNESPQINGISHQLEHLMFKGTRSRPIQFGRLFSALGSASNAFTSYDVTAYYGTARRDKLGALLTLEADRMINTVLDAANLAAEKRVVISELQGYENSPSYRLGRQVMQRAFGFHPYGLPVGGTKSEVETFTLDQVQDYYRRYYHPGNAVLVITGDFDLEGALERVDQTFGVLPGGPVPEMDTPVLTPAIAQSTPLLLEEPGSVTLLERVYPLVSNQHPDVPALDLMDAVLSAGHNSRLHQALVETGLASQVNTYSATLMNGGWYDLTLMAPPQTDLDPLETALNQTLRSLWEDPVTDAELDRARQQLITQFIFSNRDIDTQGSQLAYNEITTDDYQFSDRYLAALHQVQPQDIQRLAQTYLQPEQATQGIFKPSQLSDTPLLVSGGQTQEDFGPHQPVDPSEVSSYLPAEQGPELEASTVSPESFVLGNGLRVVLLPDHSSPTLTLAGHLQAGNAYDAPGQGGLASLVADTVMAGTECHDERALTERLESRGIHLELQSYREGVEIEGCALSKDYPLLLETLADILQRATFPAEKVALAQSQTMTQLQMELDDPARVGRRHFQQALFPAPHPFYEFPTLDSLANLRREDLQQHYQRTYRPEHLILALVGDFEVAAMQDHLHQWFGEWQRPLPAPALVYPPVTPPSVSQQLKIPLAGKTQVYSYLGHVSFKRSDPCYYGALILNEILGGDTLSSRLGNEIRDRLGLTYGIYSYFSAGQETGSFVIELQTAPEDTEAALQTTLKLVRQLVQTGVTAAEFQTVQRSLLNAYPIELASPDSVAQRMLLNAVDGLPPEEMRRVPERIAAVTLDQVQHLAPQLIYPDQMIQVSAGSGL